MLSFPPLLDSNQWKGASQGRTFPGSQHTWKKALAPRPLNHPINKDTVMDLQAATGGRFNLLHETVKLPEEMVRRDGVPSTIHRPYSGCQAQPSVL